MKLKLTVRRGSGAPGDDVVVSTEPAATVADVASRIARDPEPRTDRTLAVTFPGETTSAVLAPSTPISEAPIASGAVVALQSSGGTATGGPVLALLRVVEGPDAGREFQLRSGTLVIGRDASCDIVLSDPLVSKRHARVDVTRTVDLVDLNSANGIVVDGGQVTRASLASGATLQLGDDVIRVDIVAAPDVAEAPRREGTVEFNRSPRVEPRYQGTEFEGPEVPREIEPTPFPWVALAAPAILGIAFLFIPGVGPLRFLFIALAPIIMIGTYINQLATRRRKHKLAVSRFEDQLAFLSETLGREAVAEREVRLQEAPATEELVRAAAELGPLLWTRRPEHWSFLNVRLGLGSAPSRNTVTGVNKRGGIREYLERFDQLVDAHQLLDGVPIVDNLREAGAVGIAGGAVEAVSTANSLLMQLAGLYSPSELTFAAVTSPGAAHHFDWLKWLPHTSSPASPLTHVQLADTMPSGNAVVLALEELIEQRAALLAGGVDQRLGPLRDDDSVMLRGSKVGVDDLEPEDDERPQLPGVVVLISDDAPVDRARLVSLAERGALAGVYPIWVASTVAELPAACRTFVDVTDPAQPRIGVVRAGDTFAAEVDRRTGEQAQDFARRLSGVVDAGALVADQSDVPTSVTLASLLGTEMLSASDAIIDRWRQNDSLHDRTPGAPARQRRPGRLRAIVGQGSLDSMHLDLREQGPHALVGGTTGSGKSEFLQSWVLAMAAEYSPDRVTFLFVDYKGGSAFADCVRLPHSVGLVTDLSPHLVRRALTSLRAELQFREHLFNRKKAKDISELERRGDPECPPSLVIVIDEFAALVGEVPEFVDGVVDVAQRGRSLGIHLIMATQRPAGVIRDNLRANTNLRIALRMADEHDSSDVIGSPIAAAFDPGTPGRAIARIGPGRLVAFQSGYAGGWTSEVAPPPDISISDLRFGFEEPWERELPTGADDRGTGPNDVSRLVSTMMAASSTLALPTPRKPWLDELAPVYDLALLHQRTDEELVIGVSDDPRRQAQYPVHFRPDTDGNLAVFGTAGSGKSVALRTLAIAAGITPRGGPVQVYGLDFSTGGLRMLEALPHVGSIVGGEDQERVVRLLSMLTRLIDERAAVYAQARAGSISEYRRLASKPEEPRILLLVDGLAAMRQEYEFTQHPAFSMFQQVLSEGRQVGVHVVVSVDRPGTVSPSIGAAIPRRLVLRLAEESDYAMLDTPPDILGAGSPPGRAVIDGLETQVAVFGGSSNVAAQAKAVDGLAEAMTANGVSAPPAVGRLADEVPYSALGRPRAGQLAIGIADDDLQSVSIDPVGTFMLAGPPGSGRTSALLLLAQGARAALPGARMFYFGNARSELGQRAMWERAATTLDEAVELSTALLEDAQRIDPVRRMVVVVESVSDFLSTPADAPLTALLKAARRADQFLIGESESSTWSQSWPLLLEFKSGRRGFALQPDTHEGDLLFKTTFPRARRSDFPPGRGWLVQGGRVRKVQLAMPRRAAES